jgi:hypothetical protein
MTTRLIAFTALLLLLLTSCEGDVRFTSDQPKNLPALAEVPPALRGKYVNGTDSLYVESKSITLVRPSQQSLALSDTAKVGLVKGKNGNYIFKSGSDRYVGSLSADSFTIVNRNAQVYRLGKDTVLKVFNGSWWLSMKTLNADKKEEWKLMQIALHKNKLSIAVPALPKDEKKRMQQRMEDAHSNVDSSGVFSVVTPFNRSSDQTYYIVSASPDQLKNLDRRGLFRPIATFEKVK